MLIRIRSKDGNFRFELDPAADVSKLAEKIFETAPTADPQTITISNQPRGNDTLISKLKGRTLQTLGLKHGDMVFVSYEPKQAAAGPSTQEPEDSHLAKRPWELAKEDPVDAYWRSQNGQLPRGRDALFCKHGANAMCDNCMPLEPYDAAYQKEHNIKHLSYHAYLRKLTPKSSGSSASHLPPLNPLSFKVKVPCPSGHPSWPAGICTACQPSAITLQSQPYRMVDHLEIASVEIIDRFLEAWRKTGQQRFGWLVGRYEPYDKVPMGVKAVVEAIYEPPQQGELDGLTLGLPWEDEARIRELSKLVSAPLTVVGYVFTDLEPTAEDRSKSVYKRHPGSFFLSSLEVIFAATMQNANPMPSQSSSTGVFGSRLVTAVLTASEDGQVDIAAYMVSEQACAMVDADMIEASVDPGIVRVKEDDRGHESARYVPDVFYRYKNEYGLEVKNTAKPCFPVEYLLVNVTHGFPQNPSALFRSAKFSIENRPGLEDQRVEGVIATLSKLGAPEIQDSRTGRGDYGNRMELTKWISDWHLVAFLQTTQLFSPEDIKVFMEVASAPTLLEDPLQLDRLIGTEGWQTLMTFTRESSAVRTSADASAGADDEISQDILDQIAAQEAASGGSGSGAGRIRICPHCTYDNTHAGSDCEVCGLPLA